MLKLRSSFWIHICEIIAGVWETPGCVFVNLNISTDYLWGLMACPEDTSLERDLHACVSMCSPGEGTEQFAIYPCEIRSLQAGPPFPASGDQVSHHLPSKQVAHRWTLPNYLTTGYQPCQSSIAYSKKKDNYTTKQNQNKNLEGIPNKSSWGQ